MANNSQNADRFLNSLTSNQKEGLFQIFQHLAGSGVSPTQSNFSGWVGGQIGQGPGGGKELLSRYQGTLSSISKQMGAIGGQPQYTNRNADMMGPEQVQDVKGLGPMEQSMFKLNSFMDSLQAKNIKGNEVAGQQFAGLSKGVGIAKEMGIPGADAAGGLIDKAMMGTRAAAGDPTAIAQLVKEGIQFTGERAMGIGKHAMNAFNNDSPFAAAGEGLKAGGDAATLALGPMGPVLAPVIDKFTELGAAVLGVPDKMKAFSNELHNANMQFAEFSGSMAAVQAQQQVRDIHRMREQGDRRSGSAEQLAQAKSRLENSMAPIEDAFANLKNRIVAPLTEALGTLLELLQNNPIIKFIIDKANEGRSGGNNQVGETVEGSKRGREWFEEHGRPKRFGGNG